MAVEHDLQALRAYLEIVPRDRRVSLSEQVARDAERGCRYARAAARILTDPTTPQHSAAPLPPVPSVAVTAIPPEQLAEERSRVKQSIARHRATCAAERTSGDGTRLANKRPRVHWSGLVGRTVGQWRVGDRAEVRQYKSGPVILMQAVCSCGTYAKVSASNLHGGKSRQCRNCARVRQR
jgi:hypothetical protein